MSLGVRVRFEVFKRDRFTCGYCGQHPPDVLLEVDHIIPVAAGGSDEPTNLVTACWDCNRGKADRLLDEGTAPAFNPKTIEMMQERLDQAKAYMDMLAGFQGLTDEMVSRVFSAWAKAFGAEVIERESGSYWTLGEGQTFPEERSIRRFLRDLSLDDVLDAIDRTAGRMSWSDYQTCLYFYAICHRKIRDLGGR